MTYERFEDLPVWQEAIRLAEAIYDLTENTDFKCSYSLRDQIERSAMSVSHNIAEGFERGTTPELLAFIYIARGSAGETRSKLRFMQRRRAFAGFKAEIERATELALSCSRQLRGWADALQNSDIKGQRHLNNQVRRDVDQKKRAAELQKTLLANLPVNHPLRRTKETEQRDRI